MPRCLVIQHVAPEPPYALGDALCSAGVELDVRQVFAGDPLPEGVTDFDGLVVMGGPMSARSDDGFATRRAELDLIAEALRLGIPTFGICLGAQLLAAASGGEVTAGTAGAEVGWAPVVLTDECRDDPLFSGLPEDLTVLHWHSDSFSLPPDATRLATNATYLNQAFRIGELAWGLQFHLEVTAEAVECYLTAFDAEAEAAPGGAVAVRVATTPALDSLQKVRDLVLERFAALVADGASRAGIAEAD